MIFVFGETGQVARELSALQDIRCFGRDRADLSDPDACAALLTAEAPAAVINAAAYTAVDQAEREEDRATVINGTTPGAMARAAAALGVPFVQISTDYVFDGTGTAPWQPDDPTGPLGAYGRSKLKGEEAVRAADGVHAILRTSWVVSAHGANFVKTMLRLGAERERLTIVADQVGAPTCARDIAAACHTIARALIADPGKSGTYHYAGGPEASWADFARAIFAEAGLSPAVEDIPTTAYPTPATRPLNSRLDMAATEAAFGLARPDWRAGLKTILHDLKS